MSIVVTGGAGFIGSCIVRALNDAGRNDILIVDHIASTDKWMNIRNKKYRDYIQKDQFLDRLQEMDDTEAVIHMGAQSSTAERDFDYLWNNNFAYTKALWNYCSKKQIRFIYASSAAVYGDGSLGFDDRCDAGRLMPMNAYGYSKQLFDIWAEHHAAEAPKQHVGLRFFNVYGPNEYCKKSMASMVFHGYRQIKQDGEIRLFKSYRHGYEDGGQMRDFVYVKDICDVVMWFLGHPDKSGIFNIGTGKARSFAQLAQAVFQALGKEPHIRYIDMPPDLKEKYQYYTQADMDSLKSAGYAGKFRTLEDGVKDYVQEYLDKGFFVY